MQTFYWQPTSVPSTSPVESRRGAVAWACRHRSVSPPRSSNWTCGFPASGFPTRKMRFNWSRTSGQAPLLPGTRIAPTFSLSRFTLRLSGLQLRATSSLNRPGRPLSQGFNLHRYPCKLLVSYLIEQATIKVELSSTGNTRLRGRTE